MSCSMACQSILYNHSMRHALTIDVEEYFQIHAFAGVIPTSEWGGIPPPCRAIRTGSSISLTRGLSPRPSSASAGSRSATGSSSRPFMLAGTRSPVTVTCTRSLPARILIHSGETYQGQRTCSKIASESASSGIARPPIRSPGAHCGH